MTKDNIEDLSQLSDPFTVGTFALWVSQRIMTQALTEEDQETRISWFESVRAICRFRPFLGKAGRRKRLGFRFPDLCARHIASFEQIHLRTFRSDAEI
jgi:hypothetical protein